MSRRMGIHSTLKIITRSHNMVSSRECTNHRSNTSPTFRHFAYSSMLRPDFSLRTWVVRTARGSHYHRWVIDRVGRGAARHVAVLLYPAPDGEGHGGPKLRVFQ